MPLGYVILCLVTIAASVGPQVTEENAELLESKGISLKF